MYTTIQNKATAAKLRSLTGRKKILFANIPADGHFNPLTGLAVHLRKQGHDVRWYAGPSYAPKIRELGIPVLPFRKAQEVTVHNIDEVFPQRKAIKSQVKRVIFDICTYFILRGPEFFEDIQDIHASFPFDVMIADNGFTGITYVREKMHKPVITIGVMPLMESSRDLPPPILGMTPATGWLGRRKQDILRYFTDKVLLKTPNDLLRRLHGQYGIDTGRKNIFDIQVSRSSVLLMSGTPGFEYHRSDMSSHIHFIGPLLPYSEGAYKPLPFAAKLHRYEKVVLVSQGTFESDSEKLIIPVLEAFKDSRYLVIATTAGWHTEKLRKQYPYANCIIEDFIPFNQIMPRADIFVSNGGYGSTLMSISNKLPMVVAGVHEGKNEICARVGYFKLGINLRTEKPQVDRLRKAVEEVLADPRYKTNVTLLAGEFAQYRPEELCAEFVEEVTSNTSLQLSER